MFWFELEKYQQQRLMNLIVTAVMLLIYLHGAFSGLELLGGWSQAYYWENEDYRLWNRSHPAEMADGEWIKKTTAEYCTFVDENRRSDDEIKAFMEEWYDAEWRSMGYPAPVYEEVIADPYHFDNSMEVLNDEAYHSREFAHFNRLFRVYIPLSTDPVGYIREFIARYSSGDSYTTRQKADQLALTERVFRDFTPVVGDCFGWDVLICVGQQLPYSLGLVLVVVLSSLFSMERSSNIDPMLRTTKNGRGILLRAKLCRAWIITTLLWLLFQISMLVTVAVSYGLHGAEVTVMHWAGYPMPYGLSNLEYYLVQSVFSYCGALLQGLFVCVLSSLLPGRLCLPVGLVITLITGFPNTSFAWSDQCFTPWQKLTALTPGQILSAFALVQTYQSYEFGHVVIRLPCMVIIALMVEAALMLLLLHRREGGK